MVTTNIKVGTDCNTIANKCELVNHNCNRVTSVGNIVTSACYSQCQYFAAASKECYTPRLQTMVICVDRQSSCNFHEMVQCYRQMLRTAVMLRSNFLHLIFVANSTCQSDTVYDGLTFCMSVVCTHTSYEHITLCKYAHMWYLLSYVAYILCAGTCLTYVLNQTTCKQAMARHGMAQDTVYVVIQICE